jgi:anti-sigma-K factor RskA
VNATDDSHHTTEESLEAYALGALDESERVAVEAHLEDCADCRARAAALEEAANRLPLALSAASPLVPPASLEDRVMRRIEGEREPRPPRRRAVRWLQPRLALPVAAALVVAAFGAWNLHLSSALSEERSLRERLAQLVGHQETVLDVVDSERTVRRVLLRPQPAPSRASRGASCAHTTTRAGRPRSRSARSARAAGVSVVCVAGSTRRRGRGTWRGRSARRCPLAARSVPSSAGRPSRRAYTRASPTRKPFKPRG